LPFRAIDWSAIPPTQHPGAPGTATWRTVQEPGIRVRVVEYEAGYVADHWCQRGHALFVVAGELVTELQDGRRFVLGPGGGYLVGTGAEPHRSLTRTGATLFIVD
jgi:hypothetical protein